MFRRWIKLLFVVLGLAALAFFYFIDQAEQALQVANKCRDYLDTLDGTWSSKSDAFFLATCDLENSASAISIEIQVRNAMNNSASTSFLFGLSVIFTILFSGIVKWLTTGRIWK